jgi:hypothetical protein
MDDLDTNVAAHAVCSLPRLRGRGGEGEGPLESSCLPPPCPSPGERAFTPVFDGLCGRGDVVARPRINLAIAEFGAYPLSRA